MEHMEDLLRRRRGLRSALSRTVNEATEKLTGVDLAEEDIEVLVARVKKQMDNLERVDAELEPLWSEEEVEEEQKESFEYIDRATALLARLQFRLERISPTRSSTRSSQGPIPEARQADDVGNANVRVRLPKLEIIKFNGQRKNWMMFWEQFQQVVHDNQKLSTCDKFNYLRAALTGEAASAIAGLPPTERCYNDAVDILKGRFGDESLQIEDHMSRLMSLQPVKTAQDTKGLRKLHDDISSHMRALKALGVAEESFASMLYSLMIRLVPQGIVINFNRKTLEAQEETSTNSNNQAVSAEDTSVGPDKQHVTKVTEFMKFLRVEVESRERLNAHEEEPSSGYKQKDNEAKTQHTRKFRRPSSASALLHMSDDSPECFFCKAREHVTAECNATIPNEEKLRQLQEAGRCFRCTLPNHVSRRCWRKVKCEKCQKRHVSSVCKFGSQDSPSKGKLTGGTAQLSLELVEESRRPTTVLQTVVAWCKEVGADKCKVMFDKGSQRSFVTLQTAQRLKCKTVGHEALKVGVFGGRQEERTFRRVSLKLQSMYGGMEYYMEVLVTDVISTQNTVAPCSSIINEMKGRNLSVQHLVCPESREHIQVLVGTDQYWDLVTGRVLRLGSSLRAVETRLGWTVHGVCPESGIIKHCNQALVLRIAVDELETDTTLKKFWQLESIGVTPDADDERDNTVLRQFSETVKLKEGRYEVALPFKSTVDLGSNKEVALKRLNQLTRRLTRNQELLKRYDETIRMYSDEGMAERVYSDEEDVVYYMPHLAVLRDSSTTTKLRVVFDCSSSCVTAKSLNQCLEARPNLNPDVVELLMNFRIKKIALVADVQKAFLQIEVRKEDRDALRYLWYETTPKGGAPLPKIESWRMTRVPFGTTASPFLLAATLRNHFKAMEEEYPETASRLGKHMYVDDLVIGATDVQEAKKIAKEATDSGAGAHEVTQVGVKRQ
ncbi:uncharacterized protein LOC135384953 [Ornithodoros turicata]|uniref:uncharacterized protein LOC135384953 n=1 Tax=Ornithodoros turicata TaxID=34597 RepID=UPI003139F894